MENKQRVRPRLSSADQSQDVEFALDEQIDEGRNEQDVYEGRGPLGPPSLDKRYKSKRHQREFDEFSPEREKKHRRHLR